MTMAVLEIHVFKSSFQPVTALLREEGLNWSMKQQRSGEILASSGILEVALNASAWASIAAVLIAFIKARNGRKVIITTKEHKTIHVEGLSAKELEKLLEKTAWISAIDPNSKESTVISDVKNK